MTPEQIKALAKQAGGTAYVNRHYPGETAMAFGPVALVDFVRLVQAADKMPPNCGTTHCSCIECIKTCTWTVDEDGTWESGCGEAWVFNDGGPVENNCRFCHGCGKPVEVVE